MVKYRLAELEDIPAIQALMSENHVNSMNERDKADGFISAELNQEQLSRLISDEQALFVAYDDKVAAMGVCASWDFWSDWQAVQTLSHGLNKVMLDGTRFSRENSYLWGPVCISKNYRGQGIFESLFNYSKQMMSSHYPLIYTYVHEDNHRSFAAHNNKVALTYTRDIEMSGQVFKELVGHTR